MTERPDWDDYPCIEWQGTRHIAGYGMLKRELAHRVVFEQHYGHMPKEPYVVDHLCRNRLCVEPKHLQEVTRAENTRLGTVRKGPLPETCPKGHNEWRIVKSGYRRCHRCHVNAERERGRKKRAG